MPKIVTRGLDGVNLAAIKPVPGRRVKIADGGGLQFTVLPTGRRLFEFRGPRVGGKDATPRLLGEFPAMKLREARAAAMAAAVEAREAPQKAAASITFAKAFEEWMTLREKGWKAGYLKDVRERIEFNALPSLGTKPIAEISRADVIAVLKAVSDRGSHSQSRRVRALLEQLFDWGLVTEQIAANPAPKALLGAIPPRPKVAHHPAAKAADMPMIMRTLAAYPSPFTSAALRFLVLTAARTSEVRLATWDEVDLKEKVWTVPADRMKAGREHRVPLSDAAVAILKGLPRLHSKAKWIFPTLRSDRPMSENGMLYAMKGMFEHLTVHGFRSTFSTWANENRIADKDIVEAALAHVISGVRGAYDHGDRFAQRRGLMQSWAEFVSVDDDKRDTV